MTKFNYVTTHPGKLAEWRFSELGDCLEDPAVQEDLVRRFGHDIAQTVIERASTTEEAYHIAIQIIRGE